MLESTRSKDKVNRGNASQFFIAGELCRRGHSAVVTLGNTPHTDIFCSNNQGTKFVHIQVKTFKPGNKTCSVGKKAEKNYGENFFWVLGGIPEAPSLDFIYYIIPSSVMAERVKAEYLQWKNTPGAKGQERQDTDLRTVHIPKSPSGWDITQYKNRWDLIDNALIEG